MSYEYQESIKEDLKHLYEIPTGVWKYKEKLEELEEVYAKARAFDGYVSKQKLNMVKIKETVDELESYLP